MIITITFLHGTDKWERDFSSWKELTDYLKYGGRKHMRCFRIKIKE